MSKAEIKNYNWQNRTAQFSTHGSRKGVNLLGWEEVEYMSPEQEREALVARVKFVDAMLLIETNKAAKKEWGKHKHDLCLRINKLRPKTRMPEITNYVMDVLREELSTFQFNLLMKKAKKKMAEDSRNRQQQWDQ